MLTETIIFGGKFYTSVFDVKQGQIELRAKTCAHDQQEMEAWLKQNHYPTEGLMLREAVPGTLAEGFYIKPHVTKQYFFIDPATNSLVPADSSQFQDEIVLEKR